MATHIFSDDDDDKFEDNYNIYKDSGTSETRDEDKFPLQVGIGVGVGFTILFIMLALIICMHKKRRRNPNRGANSSSEDQSANDALSYSVVQSADELGKLFRVTSFNSFHYLRGFNTKFS